MCGIFGIWNRDGSSPDLAEVESAADLMRHRGPNARGSALRGTLAVAHRRLKVIDLSDRANQPFTDGDDTLVYNGELFNYRSLRNELEQHAVFHTASDTEVLFRALQLWGTRALARLEGQFAFAFHRGRDNTLLLARDHVGICPLYTYMDERRLFFSSEIRPILHCVGRLPLNPQGIADYLAYRYAIQNGHTLFQGITRFPPGCWHMWQMHEQRRTEARYWRLAWDQPLEEAAIQPELNALLDREISAQTAADVPLGLFLSGGIDSRAVLHGLRPRANGVRTFTMRFGDGDAEARQVALLARGYPLQTRFIDYAPRVLERLPEVLDRLEEPFGDTIICANDALAEAASQVVRVVLSGEGGDEAFFGYDHQVSFMHVARLRAHGLAALCAELGLALLPAKLLGAMQGYPGRFSGREKRHIARVIKKINTPGQAYLTLVRLFAEDEIKGLLAPEWVSRGAHVADEEPVLRIFAEEPDLARASMRAEIEQLTLGVNLLKQDRLTMGHSLEARVPLVSRQMLGFAGRIPTAALLRRPRKSFLSKYSSETPTAKKAFSVLASPESKHMLAALFDAWASPTAVREAGVLRPEAVAEIRSRLEAGSMLDIKRAMSILVFMAWHTRFAGYIR